MTLMQELHNSFKRGSIITRLIYLNVTVFVLLRLVEVVFLLAGSSFSLLHVLALPADVHILGAKPWTIITYMFLHQGVLHLLFNMLWLYWIGELFLRYFSSNQLLGVYFLGGICGAVLYILLYNLSPVFTGDLPNSLLLGASASVLAIVASVATYAPNHPIRLMFIGEIKMKHLALASVVIYALGMTGTNAGGNIAHVGGMIFGYVFVLCYRKGSDLTSWITQLINKIGQLFQTQPHIKVSYKNKAHTEQKKSPHEEVNRVLDKIRKTGYDSLTKEEKELLFKMGK